MPALLGIALIAWVLTQAVSAARIDHTYAKQGLVSPRLEAKYGAAAREKTARYGMLSYVADAWSDHWQRRAAALAADREAYVANPGPRVRFRDRLAQARQVMAVSYRKLVDPVPVKVADVPVEEPQLEPVPALAVDTGDVPVGTVKLTDAGREQWDGSEWEPVDDGPAIEGARAAGDIHVGERQGPAVDPSPRRLTAAEMRAEWQRLSAEAEKALDRGDWAAAVAAFDEMEARYPSVYRNSGLRSTDTNAGTSWTGSLEHVRAKAFLELQRQANDQAAATINDTTTGGTMSAPTGEAVNYETTISELEKLAGEQRGHVDACQAALKSINDAKSAINNMQESYRASAAAASSTSEHLAARNLDGVTLANAGTTADAMPAGAVDQMYDQLEAMEAEASSRLAEAEVALGATEANLTHIQATYGDAHATVAGNLSGDASFLDSGGGAGASGGSGDINFTGVMGGGGVPKVPAGGGIQHNGTGEVNVSGAAFGDNATVNSA